MADNISKVKPVLPRVIPAFDAGYDYEIPFSWTKTQFVKNKLEIYEKGTGSLLQTSEDDTIKLKHTIKASGSELKNGSAYDIRLQVMAEDGSESEFSDPVTIFCFTTPQFGFTSLTDGDTLANSMLETGIHYLQSPDEGEKLDSFQVFLYDNITRAELYKTPVSYYNTTKSIKIDGLSNNTAYYLRAIGKTTHGMELDSGFLSFTVQYAIAFSNTVLNIENMADHGIMKVTSNIKTYGWDENNCITTEDSADLTAGWINYNKGIDLSNYFVLKFTVFQPNPNSTLLKFTNEAGDAIAIRYQLRGRPGTDPDIRGYATLEVRQGILTFIQSTPFFPLLSPNDRLDLYLLRDSSNYYSLHAAVNGIPAVYRAESSQTEEVVS